MHGMAVVMSHDLEEATPHMREGRASSSLVSLFSYKLLKKCLYWLAGARLTSRDAG